MVGGLRYPSTCSYYDLYEHMMQMTAYWVGENIERKGGPRIKARFVLVSLVWPGLVLNFSRSLGQL